MEAPERSSAQPTGQTVHWVIALLLTVIATCLVLRSDGGSGISEAHAQPARVGAAGIFAFTGQLGPRTYGLFMVDVDAGNVWCYEYSRERGKLQLVAARSFLHDRYLQEFNVDSPTPGEVAELVKRLRDRKATPDGKPGGNRNR